MMDEKCKACKEHKEKYDKQLEEGRQYQDFITDELYRIGLPISCYSSLKWQHTRGESTAGIEIKFDSNIPRTGNIYVEYAEKSKPTNTEYVPSGILRNDNTWLWIIGSYDRAFIIPKNMLLYWYLNRQRFPRFKERKTETSKGITIPVAFLEKNLGVAKILNFTKH